MNRFEQIARFRTEMLVIELCKKIGTPRSQIQEIKEELADRPKEDGVRYYYYNGPLDDKTRPFCKLMLKIDKVFSDEEIQYISDNLGYSVLQYKGSYNCRHQWIQFRGKRINTPKPTQRDIRKLINNGIEA